MKKISILILIVFLINCIMPIALAVDTNEVVENNTNVKDEIENRSTPEPTASTETTTSPETTESAEPSKEPVPTESIEPSTEPTKSEEPQEEIQEEVEEENQIMLTAAGTQTIPDGKYKIKANVGSNMYLDIDAGSQSNCANVQIWQKSRVPQQEFQVTYLNNGYYSITAIHSQKVLDVSNGGMSSGTNIWQYQSNNTDAQQWVIKEVGNRKYNIISKLNGLCVDVYGAYSSNGTNVQTYQGNGSAAQQFTFEEVKEWQPKRTIKDGVYKIKANVGSNMCVDIDAGSKANEANVQIWASNNVDQQKFQVTYLNNGYYKIIALHSGKALDVNNGGTANCTNVKQYNDTGSTAQQWVIQETGQHEGYYNVASRCNNLCLDIAGGIANNGTNVQMYDYNGTEAQEFKFEEVENVEATYTIAEGTYKIASALNENQVLDVDAGSYADGTNVHIWQNQNVKQQIFSVKRIGGGLYTIEIPYSNKVLDVNNGGQTNGTNVKQDKANNGNAQKWIIKESEEKPGYYYIISKCNGIYLDVADGKANNDANIQMHEKFQDDSTRQLFKFIPYSSQEAPIIYDGSYRITSALEDIDCKAFDIDAGSKNARANLQLWSSTNVLQQKFKLIYVGDNCYNIEVVHSHMNLEVANNGMTPRTNVWQNVKNNSDAQKWIIEQGPNGYYYIKSKLNGLYLDVCDGSPANGTNIWLYTWNGSNSQKFRFDEIYFGIDVSRWNRDINYDALVNSGRADFVITRIGYTTEDVPLVVDEYYEQNYREAKARKIPLGAYVYTYADTLQEVQVQTLTLVDYLRKNNYSFELPIFFDIEDANQAPLSIQMRTDMCNTFCNIMRNYGYRPGIYSNKNMITSGIYINQIPSDVSIWVAAYGTYEYLGGNNGNIPKNAYKYYGNHDIWQFSSRGTIDGVQGVVDVDIAYKRMW